MTPDTTSQIAALRTQVFTLLLALIIVSGTLTAYLYRQATSTRKDIEALRPQAEQVIGTFNQNQKLMTDFINQLVAYSQTHPEFKPVLAKYGVVPNAAPVTPKK